jgi:hypothetical protein
MGVLLRVPFGSLLLWTQYIPRTAPGRCQENNSQADVSEVVRRMRA